MLLDHSIWSRALLLSAHSFRYACSCTLASTACAQAAILRQWEWSSSCRFLRMLAALERQVMLRPKLRASLSICARLKSTSATSMLFWPLVLARMASMCLNLAWLAVWVWSSWVRRAMLLRTMPIFSWYSIWLQMWQALQQYSSAHSALPCFRLTTPSSLQVSATASPYPYSPIPCFSSRDLSRCVLAASGSPSSHSQMPRLWCREAMLSVGSQLQQRYRLSAFSQDFFYYWKFPSKPYSTPSLKWLSAISSGSPMASASLSSSIKSCSLSPPLASTSISTTASLISTLVISCVWQYFSSVILKRWAMCSVSRRESEVCGKEQRPTQQQRPQSQQSRGHPRSGVFGVVRRKTVRLLSSIILSRSCRHYNESSSHSSTTLVPSSTACPGQDESKRQRATPMRRWRNMERFLSLGIEAAGGQRHWATRTALPPPRGRRESSWGLQRCRQWSLASRMRSDTMQPTPSASSFPSHRSTLLYPQISPRKPRQGLPPPSACGCLEP